MPIQPIAQYASKDPALLQILQGSTGVISHLFDNAIQIGRDISNKRTQQESDLLAVRGQERALAQRGAQDLQQSIFTAQKFARGAYEFDAKFGANRADTAFDQNRQTANDEFSQNRLTQNDTFSQSNADRNFMLGSARVGVAQNAVTARQGALTEKQNEAAARRQDTINLLTDSTAPPDMSYNTLVGGDYPTSPQDTGYDGRKKLATLATNKDLPLDARKGATQQLGFGNNTTARPMSESEKASLKLRQDQFDYKKEHDATDGGKQPRSWTKTEVDAFVLGNPKAFSDSEAALFKRSQDPNVTLTTEETDRLTAAKSRPNVERNAILGGMSMDEYVKRGDHSTPELVATRQKLYREYRKSLGLPVDETAAPTATPKSAVDAIPGI